MTAQLLDGKSLARQIQAEIAERVAAFRARTGVTPCLAAVLAGDDPASAVYVRNKEQACKKAGIESRVTLLSSSVGAAELLALVQQLNCDASVHGILVQLPLPAGIDATKILDAVHPLKDVDCFHPENVGLLVQGRPRYLPCTPAGIAELLVRSGVQISGAHVVVVGRSDIVGKPMANMLLQKGRDATVTVCHSRSRGLAEITRSADILIVAAGRAKLVTAEMVRPGAVVVDVGMNRTAAGLVGDVDFAAVKEVASKITPVPGGVGPLTVTMLLANTLRAAEGP
ncbi:MAG: bifunctional methylenetetrahydrofolate dehydrogenase/methenyltetrahydrofolate cyclohydrolase FolD [Planctomycetia bacterium]|nr:bifunctional methylenetetrahydrofolate dehydrogenase/methenyltetrahydrofolate cyclohydrolase FolD [Planctomycetia bacterium]